MTDSEVSDEDSVYELSETLASTSNGESKLPGDSETDDSDDTHFSQTIIREMDTGNNHFA